MQSKKLRTRLHQKAGVAVVDLYGELDGRAQEALRDAYHTARAWKARAIVLDFSGVRYINSKGIALIVGLLSEARQSSTRLLACGLSEHYLEIFEITRISDYMDIYPDMPAALLGTGALQQTVPAQRDDGSVSAL